MADAGLLVDIVELKRRASAIEGDIAEDRKTWRDYLARERRATCPAPGEIAQAIKESELKTDVKIAKMDAKLNGSLVQNWLIMGGVCAALLKIFGVIP